MGKLKRMKFTLLGVWSNPGAYINYLEDKMDCIEIRKCSVNIISLLELLMI